jgi:3-keto-L-gulonate-6-phosphate decarboxylase
VTIGVAAGVAAWAVIASTAQNDTASSRAARVDRLKNETMTKKTPLILVQQAGYHRSVDRQAGASDIELACKVDMCEETKFNGSR